eukprot:CAMPEP_0194553808 /NCGR_PEP_ID=MMETSP0253-20130528/97418_1 /TAXON_ID=2966 /ORGANISM="Noctiluca scintillans" /LENGTH=300 /DNA_ID=CAMNT_0039401289 /DNA_START=669 /DNA_END=1572 /DNA_ORIENTATION=-
MPWDGAREDAVETAEQDPAHRNPPATRHPTLVGHTQWTSVDEHLEEECVSQTSDLDRAPLAPTSTEGRRRRVQVAARVNRTPHRITDAAQTSAEMDVALGGLGMAAVAAAATLALAVAVAADPSPAGAGNVVVGVAATMAAAVATEPVQNWLEMVMAVVAEPSTVTSTVLAVEVAKRRAKELFQRIVRTAAAAVPFPTAHTMAKDHAGRHGLHLDWRWCSNLTEPASPSWRCPLSVHAWHPRAAEAILYLGRTRPTTDGAALVLLLPPSHGALSMRHACGRPTPHTVSRTVLANQQSPSM